MAHWYTADPHFGHDGILGFQKRPFRSVKEMDATIIANISACVRPNDDLWIVGDFGFGGSAGREGYLETIFWLEITTMNACDRFRGRAASNWQKSRTTIRQ